ncbi:CBM_collapsed_G0005190.mRNA.1.CDS.1 [Saccharomyces cerevisiae]|nr:CBM_collapsed_G0005190.mRNA.1.CDS.1 [Saccharomyces cerevisiae]
MSTYEEEHGIQQNSRDYQEVGGTSQEEQRRQVRSQLQGLFQNFGNTSGEGDAHSDSTLLLRLLSQMLPESLQEEWLQEMDKGKSAGCPDTLQPLYHESIKKSSKQLTTAPFVTLII